MHGSIKKRGNPAWKPGVSGNPGGRPAVIGELRDLARAHTVEAVEALVNVLRDPSAPHAAKVSAAVHLLDRGFGRPAQEVALQAAVDAHVTVDEPELSPVELARRVSFALALAANSAPPSLEADAGADDEE